MSSNKDEVKGRSEEAISRAKEGVDRGVDNKDVESKRDGQKSTGIAQTPVSGARHDNAKTVKKP
jgi:hypothetical protein